DCVTNFNFDAFFQFVRYGSRFQWICISGYTPRYWRNDDGKCRKRNPTCKKGQLFYIKKMGRTSKGVAGQFNTCPADPGSFYSFNSSAFNVNSSYIIDDYQNCRC